METIGMRIQKVINLPTVRNALGQALKHARIERYQAAERVNRFRQSLAEAEETLQRRSDQISELVEALGDEEAARWDID